MESTGQAKAEAQSRAEAARIEGEAAVLFNCGIDTLQCSKFTLTMKQFAVGMFKRILKCIGLVWSFVLT